MGYLVIGIGIAVGMALTVFASGGGAFLGTWWGSFLVVFCLGLGATAMGYPVAVLRRVPPLIIDALRPRVSALDPLRQYLMELAPLCREKGLLSLESYIPAEPGLLAQGLELILWGNEPREVRLAMEITLRCQEERQSQGQEVLHTLARNWFVFGAVGALLAAALPANPDLSGLSLARQAAGPLLCGLVLAGLVAWPLAGRIRVHWAGEYAQARIVIDGVMALQRGQDARSIGQMLEGYSLPRLHTGPPPPVRPVQQPEESADDEDEIVVEERPGTTPMVDRPQVLIRLVRQDTQKRHSEDFQGKIIDEVIARIERQELGLSALLALLSPAMQHQILHGNTPAESAREEEGGDRRLWLDDCVALPDRELQLVLKEVDLWDLVFALSLAEPALRQKFLENMQPAQRTEVIERLALVDHDEQSYHVAQRRILAVVFRLAEEGWITLPPESGRR